MSSAAVVECTRGGLREAVHPFSAVMVQHDEVRWQLGDDVGTFWRSASKPFQLLTSLSQLPAATVEALDDTSLAVGAASHSAQPEHVEKVRALLARFGLSEEQLQCGAHPPVHEPSARAVTTPTPIHNNCSGKHTFMLAACAAKGWDLDYRSPEHPLQQQNRALLDRLGRAAHQHAIDGCSVPTFFAPLSTMARAWSAIAEACGGPHFTPQHALLGRIGLAMHRAPFFVSGAERLDLLVTERASEPLSVKVGAEGLFCIARHRTGQGVAVKVHSGNADALAVAVAYVLRELGVGLGSLDWPWATVRNVRNVAVGTREAKRA